MKLKGYQRRCLIAELYIKELETKQDFATVTEPVIITVYGSRTNSHCVYSYC